MQANLVVLPERHAGDFETFCARNPRPCPLLAISRPGSSSLPALGLDIDIATDLPGYRIWRDSEITAEVTDIQGQWQADFVAFALGCSFGFETALLESGIYLPMRRQARMSPCTKPPCRSSPPVPSAEPRWFPYA